MTNSGIDRQLDKLGRITIPIELRRNLGIGIKDSVEIYKDGDKIILKKSSPCCVFTGDTEDLVDYRGKKVSMKSIKELASLAGLI